MVKGKNHIRETCRCLHLVKCPVERLSACKRGLTGSLRLVCRKVSWNGAPFVFEMSHEHGSAIAVVQPQILFN